jgi:hypothetical protein
MKHFGRKDGDYHQHCLLLNETMLMISFNALMMYILLLPSNNAQVLCFNGENLVNSNKILM